MDRAAGREDLPSAPGSGSVPLRVQLLGGAVCGLLGFALDLLPLQLFPAVHFLLGPLLVFAAGSLFGPWAGALSGLLAGVPTLWLWGHPAAWVGLTLEGAAVGRLRRRGAFPADGWFWVFGVPYVLVSYHLVTGLPWGAVGPVALKQALNGLLLALTWDVLVLLPPVRRAIRRWVPWGLRQVSLRRALAQTVALSVALPICGLGFLEGRWRVQAEEERRDLENVGAAEAASVIARERFDGGLLTAQVLAEDLAADVARAGHFPPQDELERRLERRVRHSAHLVNAYVADERARVLGFWPPLDPQGRPLVGHDFSDRAYFQRLRQTRQPVLSGAFVGRGGVQGTLVVAAAPVLVDGRLRGYVLCAFHLDEVRGMLRSRLGPAQRARILDAEDNVVLDTDAPPTQSLTSIRGTPLAAALAGVDRGGTGRYVSEPSALMLRRNRSTRMFAATEGGIPGWRIVVEQPFAVVTRAIEQTYLMVLVSLLAAVSMAALAAYLLGNVLAAPLGRISSAARRFAAGDRDARVTPPLVDGPPELLQLADTFNRMAAELSEQLAVIERSSQEKDAFLSVASHELKTPLTSLKLRMQILERALGPEEAASVTQIERQVDRLTRLVHQLLDVSQLASGKLLLEPRPFDLAELVRRVSEDLVASSPRHSLVLHLAPCPGVWDELRLEQVLHNLLSNAVKYSPQGGSIEVALERRGDEVELRVDDAGVGVKAEVVETLFQRFARGEHPQVSRVAGMGVGLFVSREIVRQHGGHITLVPRSERGTRAVVRLPLAPPRAGAMPLEPGPGPDGGREPGPSDPVSH